MSSGISPSGQPPLLETHSATTSGSSSASATIDPSLIADSTANQAFEVSTSDGDKIKSHRISLFDLMTILSIVFQIILWTCFGFYAYNFLKPLYIYSLAPIIVSTLAVTTKGIDNPLIIGILSSILATIIVLITRDLFYRIQSYFPAGALFRNIARVSNPCFIFTLRMKDTTQSGEFITPIPEYSPVHDPHSLQDQFETRQNTPWVTSTPEAQSLAHILNVLGRVGRSENLQLTFVDKEYDRWDIPMFTLGGSWKTMRAIETCKPYFRFNNNTFTLSPTNQRFDPSSPTEDMGLLQKMINPTTGLPVWVVMGYRGAGTIAASYALVRWWKCLGILYGNRPFGLIVAFDDRDGWQQSHIVTIYPKPKWHVQLRHPYTWYLLKRRIKSLPKI